MRKFLLASLSIFTFQTLVFAQWSQSMFNSPNQQMVEDAVRNGIILVCQDYQLRDTVSNQKYGRNHETHFGSVYSIAAKVMDALSVSNRFVRPWDYDINFTQYRNSQYQPVVSKTTFRALSDSTFSDLRYSSCNIRVLKDSVVYYVDSLSHQDRGFIVDHNKGEKDGWLVWAFVNDSTSVRRETISLVTYRHKVSLEDGLHSYAIKQPTVSGHILGGIYVCPTVTTIGTIEFLFEGLIVSDGQNRWQFYTFCDINQGITEISESPSESEGVLTPVNEEPRQDRNTRSRSRNRNR